MGSRDTKQKHRKILAVKKHILIRTREKDNSRMTMNKVGMSGEMEMQALKTPVEKGLFPEETHHLVDRGRPIMSRCGSSPYHLAGIESGFTVRGT